MMSRRHWHISALAAAALIVAGCGGGDDSPLASRVIVFGDSVSDVGTYTPATQIPLGQNPGVPPFFGGKWTTNSHTGYTATSNTSTANIWVEWVAARLGVAITPAEVGFVTTRVPCPAAATVGPNSCTGYAQGGSRVTDPNGIGKSAGALTIPIVDQISSHNTRVVQGFKTGFGDGDMVFVLGGNNDVFVQFGLVGASAIAPEVAVAAVQTAATELATLVKNEIIAKGAKRVAVMSLPDFSVTPEFSGLPADNKAFLNQLTDAFNGALLTGLNGSSARIINLRALGAAVVANPSAFGITNVTQGACDPAKISAFTGGRITNGSALFCNAAPASAFVAPVPNLNGLKTGASASTYLFADGVHPTTAGHKILGDQVWSALKDFGWVPSNL
jgi:phospholipase/lecithinase/hemolysin